MQPEIHPLAVVDPDVVLGEGTVVRQFASVTRGAILGANCRVSPFVMLDGSKYGNECVFSAGFAAGAGFLVGDRVFFGPNSTLVNDVWPRPHKNGYDDETLRGNQKFAVIIGNNVIIGSNSVIMAGVRIGTGAVIPAGSVVKRNVQNFELFHPDNDRLLPRRVPVNQPRMRWAE